MKFFLTFLNFRHLLEDVIRGVHQKADLYYFMTAAAEKEELTNFGITIMSSICDHDRTKRVGIVEYTKNDLFTAKVSLMIFKDTEKIHDFTRFRVKKILEKLSRTQFLTEFEFRALFFGAT